MQGTLKLGRGYSSQTGALSWVVAKDTKLVPELYERETTGFNKLDQPSVSVKFRCFDQYQGYCENIPWICII